MKKTRFTSHTIADILAKESSRRYRFSGKIGLDGTQTVRCLLSFRDRDIEEKQGHNVHKPRDEMSSIHKRSFGGEESLAKRLDHHHQGKLGLSQDHYLVVGDQTRIDNVFGSEQLASGGVGGGGGLRLKSEGEMFGGVETPLRHERQPGIERLAGSDGALGERLSATEKFSRVAFHEERLGAKTHQLNAVENGALSRYVST